MYLSDDVWKIVNVLKDLVGVDGVKRPAHERQTIIKIRYHVYTPEASGVQADRAGEFVSTTPDVQSSFALKEGW
jgi:hypothetical protein